LNQRGGAQKPTNALTNAMPGAVVPAPPTCAMAWASIGSQCGSARTASNALHCPSNAWSTPSIRRRMSSSGGAGGGVVPSR